MLVKFIHSFSIALEAILHNKLRAFLTSLGVIFGVASVIAMQGIGSGAEKVILEQMKLLGTNNLVISPNTEKSEGKILATEDQKSEKRPFTPGLTLADANNITMAVPHVEYVSSEIILETLVIRSSLKRTGKLVGIDEHYFEVKNFNITAGRQFSPYQLENSLPVCIIGSGIKTRFFTGVNPLGQLIKCGQNWLKVIGILDEISLTGSEVKKLGLRDFNMDIYTPINTILLRYENRGKLTPSQVASRSTRMGNVQIDQASSERSFTNYNQLDKIIVHIDQNEYMSSISDIVNRMLKRRHNDVVDYEITIPELLIQQEQKTKRIFNFVLGAIASISLLVGGIGVMNIMLASVLDRFKEIGLRQALGASRKDIILQFINESVTLTVSGGVCGILLGFIFCYAIERSTGIETLISPLSVVVSFVVSISVGLIFGIYPAQKAATHDPVVLLRHD